jgi:hypothetical protein
MTPEQNTLACSSCRHFRTDTPLLERAIPHLAALSSGYASSRADDGVCAHHDRLVLAAACCSAFAGG